MIESSTLKLMLKAAPNYHLVSEKFARESFGVCGKTGAGKAKFIPEDYSNFKLEHEETK